MKTDWATMSWLEVREAAEQDRVVIVPFGCIETHGPYSPTGLEYLMSGKLAQDVAKRKKAIALPSIPYGNSDTFRANAGTIYIRQNLLTEVYKEVLTSIVRSGFQRILCLTYHIPNQPCIKQAAQQIREETGISVTWVNPGSLATTYMKELFDDPVAARGHGAEPGMSLARYVAGIVPPADPGPGEKGAQTYGGFTVNGAALEFRNFPIGMPFTWNELYPESGGYGNPSMGSAEIGNKMYDGIVDFLCAVVDVVATMDPRDPEVRF